jgi:hypothetical protein
MFVKGKALKQCRRKQLEPLSECQAKDSGPGGMKGSRRKPAGFKLSVKSPENFL